MNVARNAAEALAEHTMLELECIDRMYLNIYVPVLQTGAGAAHFFRKVRAARLGTPTSEVTRTPRFSGSAPRTHLAMLPVQARRRRQLQSEISGTPTSTAPSTIFVIGTT